MESLRRSSIESYQTLRQSFSSLGNTASSALSSTWNKISSSSSRSSLSAETPSFASASQLQETTSPASRLWPFLPCPLLTTVAKKRSPHSSFVWQERFLQLFPDLLIYAQSSASSIPSGLIPLDSIILVSCIAEDSTRMDFIVRSRNQTHTFAFDFVDEATAARWTSALQELTLEGRAGKANDIDSRYYNHIDRFWQAVEDIAKRRRIVQAQLHYEYEIMHNADAQHVVAQCTITNPFVHKVIKSGALKKKSPSLGQKLQDRYFVLYPSLLVYAIDQEGVMQGSIAVLAMEKVSKKDDDSIEISVSKCHKSGRITVRIYTLIAPDFCVRDQWYDALCTQTNLYARAYEERMRLEQQNNPARTLHSLVECSAQQWKQWKGSKANEMVNVPSAMYNESEWKPNNDLPIHLQRKESVAVVAASMTAPTLQMLSDGVTLWSILDGTASECRVQYDRRVLCLDVTFAEAVEGLPTAQWRLPLSLMQDARLIDCSNEPTFAPHKDTFSPICLGLNLIGGRCLCLYGRGERIASILQAEITSLIAFTHSISNIPNIPPPLYSQPTSSSNTPHLTIRFDEAALAASQYHS